MKRYRRNEQYRKPSEGRNNKIIIYLLYINNIFIYNNKIFISKEKTTGTI